MSMIQDARRNEPIAIVGMGCRFPGGASKPSRLWELLKKPIDVSQEVSKNRFNLRRFYHKDGPHHGTTNSRTSYFLKEDPSLFDTKFFNVPPGEAAAIDPQQRLLLEVVYEAVDSAGLSLHGMAGSNTGVYVGIMCQDYFSIQAQDVNSVPRYAATGIAASNASSRISYFFDWHGPSMTIDTACSSSMVGVHEAVQALRSGTSSVAVACGTNLLLSAFSYITESNLGMLSSTGKSRMWDVKADGYARGEGVASVVLKTLNQAVRDGDRIEGVIREIGVNHDGRTRGLTMPSAAAQAALIRETYHRAGLDPTTKAGRCQFFEAHGTGTPAGDPQEAEALSRAFFPAGSSGDSEDDVLLVGSIKTVIGHTEGTAGLAGLIKACLALQNSTIPPNLLFDEPNPAVVPFMRHLRIPTSSQPWPPMPVGTPRRASVNSFGFGGTNAHAILESHEPPSAITRESEPSLTRASQVSTIPLVLSAASEKSLVEVVKSMLSYLDEQHQQQQQLVNLPDLAWTLASKRSALPHRLCVPATSIDQLRQKLDACLATVIDQEKGKDSAKLGISSLSGPPSILGIFTGQGAQWPQMGARLIETIPAAAAMLARLDLSLSTLPVPSHRPPWTLAGQLAADKSTSRVAEAALSQPLCTAVQILLVELLRHAGVTFRAVVGHSSGEIGAAYAAGFLSASDAIRISYYRGFYAKLAAGTTGESGGMLAVGTSIEDARELCDIDDFADSLWLAAHNSPTSVTLSGDKMAVDQALDILEEEGKFARALRVDTAYHSGHMARCEAAYLASLRTCRIVPLRPDPAEGAPLWFSSVYDDARAMCVERSELDAQYWVDNMTKPVLFFSAVRAAVSRDTSNNGGLGLNAALELGPHPALQGPAQDTIRTVTNRPLPYSGTLKRGADDVESFAAALGSVWAHFGPTAVDLGRFQEKCSPGLKFRAIADLPSYPWDHGRSLWAESRYSKLFRTQDGRFHDLLGLLAADGMAEECRWRNTLDINEIAWLSDHSLQGQPVFPGAGYILMAMEAGMELAKAQPVESVDLLDLEIIKAIALSEAYALELVVSITNIRQEATVITAKYTVFSTASEDALHLSLNATGNVRITLQEEGPESEGTSARLAAARSPPVAKLAPVDVDRFYQVLGDDLGYGYQGPFRRLVKIQRRLGFSTSTIQNTTFGEHETCLLFHPGTLDCALQALNAAYSAPGDGCLWQIVAPTYFKRVTLIPALCGPNITDLVEVDCTITDDTNHLRISGDIEVYCADKRVIEVERVCFSPFSAATSKDDRHMFQEAFLCLDEPDADVVFADVVSSSVLSSSSAQEQHQKGIDAERAAFYYLKHLHQHVSPHVRKDLPWYRQSLLNNAEKLYELVKSGHHPHANKTWVEDTKENIEAMMDAYGDDADFNLTRAVGEYLLVPEILRGDTSILEHMTHKNYLDRYYTDAIGFETLNQLLAGVMAQLGTKFPRMNILEIGAGTGSGTQAILGSVDSAFASYTYTDISSGFFDKAADRFRAKYGHKMVFKVLDIGSEPGPQGFAAGAYDVVVASNVLHATKSMRQTLTHTRTLLKPGGFLVLLEVIRSDVMRHGLVMGGLPGWWVGREDGRETGPSLTLTEWDAVLRQTGFGGIETSSPMPDVVTLPGSVFVSRAINDQVSILREPLARPPAATSGGPLLVIGGEGELTHDICSQLASHLKQHFDPVIRIPTIDFLPEQLPSDVHVVSLAECDSNMFEEMDSVLWEKFKRLLSSTTSMLWLLCQSRGGNPHGGTTLGLFRTLFYELPGTLLQTLDLGQGVPLKSVDPSTLAELLLRLMSLNQMMRLGDIDKLLWNFEPELVLQRDGRVYVPRVRQNETLNARYNSSKRSIKRLVDAHETQLELVKSEDDGSYFVREKHHVPDNKYNLEWEQSDATSGFDMTDRSDTEDASQADMVTIKVSWSLLTSLKTPAGYFFIQLGRDIATGNKTMCWSNSNTSTVTVHRSFAIRVDQDDPGKEIIDAHYMSFVVGELLAQQIMSHVPQTGIVMAHEPDPTVSSLLARHLVSVGRKAVFTTSRPGGGRMRNWIYLHPNSPKRLIDAAVPPEVSLYVVDTSNALSSKDSLGARICDSLPELCERLHLESLSSSKASDLPDKAPKALVRLLRKSQEFGSSQRYTVPDGKPLDILTLKQVVAAQPRSRYSLVSWEADTHVPTLIEPVTTRQDLFRPDRTYWLAGLGGDLGRSLADFMIAHGAANVAISSRTPLVDEGWLAWHKDRGATVTYHSCDLTNYDQTKRVRDDILKTMPPIAGVANGAMVLRDVVVVQMTFEQLDTVLRSKVQSTLNLDRLFSSNVLDWFVGFSSIVAMTGNPGQAAYSAGNAFIKAVVQQRRARGLAGSTIDISRVIGVGYIERESVDGRLTRQQQQRLQTRSSTLAMCETDLHQLLAEAIINGRPGSSTNPEIITGLEYISVEEAKSAFWAMNARFGLLVREEGSLQAAGGGRASAVPVWQLLEAAQSMEDVSRILLGVVKSKLQALMFLTDADSDSQPETTPLVDLGVDSLVGVELRSWLLKELGAGIPVMKILSGVSMLELVDTIVEKLPKEFKSRFEAQPE